MHMYIKYEVFMSNPVPGGGVHRCQRQPRRCRTTTHEAWLYNALWLVNQMRQIYADGSEAEIFFQKYIAYAWKMAILSIYFSGPGGHGAFGPP